MTTWPVRHPGIGVLRYATGQEATTAAGTAGTVLPPEKRCSSTDYDQTCSLNAGHRGYHWQSGASWPAEGDGAASGTPAPAPDRVKASAADSAGQAGVPDAAVRAFEEGVRGHVQTDDCEVRDEPYTGWCCDRAGLAAAWPHLAAQAHERGRQDAAGKLRLEARRFEDLARAYAATGDEVGRVTQQQIAQSLWSASNLIVHPNEIDPDAERRAGELEGDTDQEGHRT